MDCVRSQQVSYRGDRSQALEQKIKDNSTGMTIGGATGAVTFATISQSSKIGNGLVGTLKRTSSIKTARQNQLLSLLEKCKPLAKFANNPLVKRCAGVLGGLSAATSLLVTAAQASDTCEFLMAQNPNR